MVTIACATVRHCVRNVSMVEEPMMAAITVRLSMKSKQQVKLWEVYGISTPVRYAVVTFSGEDDNILTVACHKDNLKVLRLAKLRHYKRAWNISKICGYYGARKETVRITLPSHWRDKSSLNAAINNFLRYLLCRAWVDF